MAQFRILQSLWAMERRRADEAEWPLQTQLTMIRDAGFDGVGVRFVDPALASQVTDFLRQHGMIWQAQCYPTCIDDLKTVLELVARLGGGARLPFGPGKRMLSDCRHNGEYHGQNRSRQSPPQPRRRNQP
jgi:hypothetical protein